MIFLRTSKGIEKFGALKEFEIPVNTDLRERFSMANQHTILQLIVETIKLFGLKFRHLTKIEVDAGGAGIAAIKQVCPYTASMFYDSTRF